MNKILKRLVQPGTGIVKIEIGVHYCDSGAIVYVATAVLKSHVVRGYGDNPKKALLDLWKQEIRNVLDD